MGRSGTFPLVGTVDKSIPTPLYYQLEQIIRGAIEAGRLEDGDVIPTELELADYFGISRATVRQATQQLVNDGLLHRERSKGTIVTVPRQQVKFLGDLKGFTAEMRQRSIPFYSVILDMDVVPAPELIAKRLAIAVEQPVFYLKRLRYVNEKPFLIVENYIDYRLCPGIEQRQWDKNDSLYSVLETEYGLQPHHGWREFEPVMPASDEEAALLKIKPDTSLLYVESVAFLQDGTPLECFGAKVHGRFRVDLFSS